ncbi:MAG: T9SS type A sorting domain-containing protein, partial [Candidatus Cloacimonetes bacterium]|nr:T9SS type A sorting domain-containing protein [Candidatus Cloacimonadota bacterium]
YSFGESFGEGTGIPAWAGDSGGWIDAAFDLTSWANENIIIRFAFASDANACTIDEDGDATWFGVRIDEINIGDLFFSNADAIPGDTVMQEGYGGDYGGDFWSESQAESHSPSTSMWCEAHPNLIDELVTSWYHIPDNGDVSLNYWLNYQMLDSDGDNDNIPDDYLAVYAKSSPDIAWTRLHIITAGMLPETGWYHVTDEWLASFAGNLTTRLEPWAGFPIQLKFVVITDNNDDGGIGTGLYLDDVEIIHEPVLPAPYKPQVIVNTAGTVELTWQIPHDFEQLEYFTGQFNYFVNDLQPYAVSIVNDSSNEVLLCSIDAIFSSNEFAVQGSPDFYIWNTSEGVPDSLLYTIPNNSYIPNNSWFSLDVSEYNIMIPSGDTLFVGFDGLSGGEQGIAAEDAFSEGHHYCMLNSVWTEISVAYGGISNLALTATILQPVTADLPSEYEVYRKLTGQSWNLLTTVTDTSFADFSPIVNHVNDYSVKAVYSGNSSPFSETLSILIPSDSVLELVADDGSAEGNLAPLPGEEYAVSFSPFDNFVITYCSPTYFKVFITSPGLQDIQLLLYSAENDCVPQEELVSVLYPAELLSSGWNYLEVPDPPELDSGKICVSVRGAQSVSTIGLDEDNTGDSYIFSGGQWSTLDTGNCLLRLYFDTQVAINNETSPCYLRDVVIAPNPFNPETTIRYQLQAPSEVVISIYNIRGQLVKNFEKQHLTVGAHSLIWNGRNQTGEQVAGGVYFCRISTDSDNLVKKMLLLK